MQVAEQAQRFAHLEVRVQMAAFHQHVVVADDLEHATRFDDRPVVVFPYLDEIEEMLDRPVVQTQTTENDLQIGALVRNEIAAFSFLFVAKLRTVAAVEVDQLQISQSADQDGQQVEVGQFAVQLLELRAVADQLLNVFGVQVVLGLQREQVRGEHLTEQLRDAVQMGDFQVL